MRAKLIAFISSRKFIAGTGTALLLAGCWVVSNWLPRAAEHFGVLATSLVGLFTTYAGGNLLHHHLAGTAGEDAAERTDADAAVEK